MTARRLRESPRLLIAGALLAALLVALGVLVGSATSSGSSSSSALNALRQRSAHQTEQLRAQTRILTALRGAFASADRRLALTQSQLITARAKMRCWRAAALHHVPARVSSCAAPP